MSKALFFNISAYGHVNPTLGLVKELVNEGEEVTYFCSEEFKEQIENCGAKFRSLGEDAECLKIRYTSTNLEELTNYIKNVLESSGKILKAILEKINGEKFDYIVYGSMFPFGSILSQILKIPSVSSFAVFATPQELIAANSLSISEDLIAKHPLMKEYNEKANKLKEMFNVEVPNVLDLFFNKGDLNIAYTSEYFVSNNAYYDKSFKFIGPPVYNRKENTDDFPFEKLKGRKVIYISLGTVFNDSDDNIYDIFFEAFKDSDVVVIMTAYGIDISKFNIPKNFIVKNYVPQTEILKYTDVAITHGGMNSTSDLICNDIPFVAIPFGADQPYIAKRVSELGAAISLDKDKLTPDTLRSCVKIVETDRKYKKNMRKIKDSFKKSGGYKMAVQEIFKLKKQKNIIAYDMDR